MRQSAPCHSWLSLRLCDPNTQARWRICCQEETDLPPDDDDEEEKREMGHTASGAVPPSLYVMRFLMFSFSFSAYSFVFYCVVVFYCKVCCIGFNEVQFVFDSSLPTSPWMAATCPRHWWLTGSGEWWVRRWTS